MYDKNIFMTNSKHQTVINDKKAPNYVHNYKIKIISNYRSFFNFSIRAFQHVLSNKSFIYNIDRYIYHFFFVWGKGVRKRKIFFKCNNLGDKNVSDQTMLILLTVCITKWHLKSMSFECLGF